jgi:hypothetical protein
MEDIEEKTPIQKLRAELSKSCPSLPDYKIIELCQDYGIQYDIPDSNTLRVFMILAAAENKLLKGLVSEWD